MNLAPVNEEVQSPFVDGKQFAWDSTSAGLAQTCLRKYYYKMICGWKPKYPSVHLLFGGLYAAAIEFYFKQTYENIDPEEALINTIQKVLIDSWEHETDDEGNPIEDTGEAKLFIHNAKTRENLVRTIIWYFEEFANDSALPARLQDGTPAVEHSFKIDIGDGILYSGHLDRLANYQDDFYFMDQKTTGIALSSHYFSQFDLSFQMSGYTFAGSMILGQPVKGGIIDAAQVLVGHSKYERSFTTRTKEQLDEWLETFHNLIETVHRAVEINYFPMNLSSCGNYGGCEFHKVCSKTPRLRESFLRADFDQKPIWNPLETR